MFIKISCFLLLTSGVALADKNGVCLIRNEPSSNGGSCGSGFFIDGGILTAYHVVEDNIKTNKRIRVEYKNQICMATVKRYDKDSDLALISADGIADYTELKIAELEPSIGSKVINFGHPMGKWIVHHSIGRLKNRLISRYKNSRPIKNYSVRADVSLGMSGGPLIDPENNTVIGLLSTKAVDKSAYTAYNIALPEILQFLKEKPHEKP